MKKRIKFIAGGLALALCAFSALTSCAFSPNMDMTVASPDLKPMPEGSVLFNEDDESAIAAPDVYWMYDDLDSLVKGSDLIVFGSVSGSQEKVIRLRADNESFHELFNESATLLDIEPLMLIKGGEGSDIIHMASYAGIAKNTMEKATLDLYESKNSALNIPYGKQDGKQALFFLKNAGGDMYFPVNVSQGLIPVSGEKLMPLEDNNAIPEDTELPDIVDSIRYLMNFLDEPTATNYRPFIIEED